VISNLIGTTGASMLLIRPMLRTNSERKHTWHIPVFFIFVVSNVSWRAHTDRRSARCSSATCAGWTFFWTLSNLWVDLAPVLLRCCSACSSRSTR
jgi:hypothetical protein